MSGGQQGGTSTTVSRQELPDEAKPHVKNILERAGGLADSPFTYYSGSTVSPHSPETQAAMNMQTGRAMGGSPLQRAGQDQLARTMAGDFFVNTPGNLRGGQQGGQPNFQTQPAAPGLQRRTFVDKRGPTGSAFASPGGAAQPGLEGHIPTIMQNLGQFSQYGLSPETTKTVGAPDQWGDIASQWREIGGGDDADSILSAEGVGDIDAATLGQGTFQQGGKTYRYDPQTQQLSGMTPGAQTQETVAGSTEADVRAMLTQGGPQYNQQLADAVRSAYPVPQGGGFPADASPMTAPQGAPGGQFGFGGGQAPEQRANLGRMAAGEGGFGADTGRPLTHPVTGEPVSRMATPGGPGGGPGGPQTFAGGQDQPQSAGEGGAFRNPYLTGDPNAYAGNVLDSITQQVQPAVDSQFARAGRSGQSPVAREAMGRGIGNAFAPFAFGAAESERGRQFAGGESQADREFGGYQSERGRQMDAARMAPGQAQADYADIARLGEVGTAREDLLQQQINEQIQRQQFGQQAPWNLLQQYANLAYGTPGGTTTSTGTGVGPRRNVGQGMLGGAAVGSTFGPWGAAGGGILGALGAFG